MKSLDRLRSFGLRSANRALSAGGVYLERTTRRRTLHDFLVSRRVDTVYDVGANQGQFGVALREAGYTGRIVSFEPVSSAVRKLSATAAGSPPWDVFNTALSDRNGTADINVSEYSVFSSFNQTTERAGAFHPETRTVRVETVALGKLDDAVAGDAGSSLFLKVDTQGHEQAVLRGAEHTLGRFCGIALELPVQQLYAGNWNLEEAIAFMRERGFVLSNVVPTNFDVGNDDMSVLELDCVFKNEAQPGR